MTGRRSLPRLRLTSIGAPVVAVAPCAYHRGSGLRPDRAPAPRSHARRYGSLDVDALRAFIRDRVGKGPTADAP